MSEVQSSRRLSRIASAVSPHRRLLNNAGSMVGTSVATAGLGVIFWLLAAREFSTDAVGIAGAAISAMTLFGFISTLGLGTLLMGELPRVAEGRRLELLSSALVVAGIAGVFAGLFFALAAPLLSDNLDSLRATPAALASFTFGVGLTALALVLDQSLIGLLRGSLQLRRNIVFAGAKLLALIAVALVVSDAGAAWIFSTWTIGIAVSLIVLTPPTGRTPGSWRPDVAAVWSMRGAAAWHAAVNLGLETADLAMPVIVLVLLSPGENASFFIAWMITNIMIMVPLSLSMVAYAIGSGEGDGAGSRFRFTLLISYAFAVVANLVLLVAARPVLGLFGPSYTEATAALQIMAVGVLPLTIKVHYVALSRLRRQLRRALPLVWAGTVLELAGGVIGALVGGLNGVAIGWLAGLTIEALAMAGPVLREIRAEATESEGSASELERRAGVNAATVEHR